MIAVLCGARCRCTFDRMLSRFLRCLPPEIAHAIAITLLRLQQFLVYRLGRRKLTRKAIVHVADRGFSSRVGLAAGFDKNAEAFASLARMGFGFLEVGTVTPLPQAGNDKPRLFRESPSSLVNRMGFNNCGLERFRRHVESYRRYMEGVPIFCNVGKGRDTPLERALDDYRAGIERLTGIADGFVVNVSSPNTKNLVSLQSIEFIEGLARFLPEKAPTWIKLSPDLNNEEMKALFSAVMKLPRIAGVVLANTSRGRAEAKYPEGGGWSGPPLLSRSLECVGMAREFFGSKKTIIGVGGVSSVEDYRRMRMAGADLVEIYTAFIYQGPALVRQMAALHE